MVGESYRLYSACPTGPVELPPPTLLLGLAAELFLSATAAAAAAIAAAWLGLLSDWTAATRGAKYDS
jgi:hypothetical protein